jgi:integrase
MNQIKSTDIIKWQNKLMNVKDKNGKKYSGTYLKTINNQLTAIFNHAVKYYDLKVSPMAKVGAMGAKNANEMNFWTRTEYLKFIEQAKDESKYYHAFQVLYWCGLRVGELLALTHADIDTDAKTVTINKSYQRLHGEDVVTDPKTKKSNRVVTMPDKLATELVEYKAMFYDPDPSDRLFPFLKDRLYGVMDKCAAAAGVKRIRIHDLRHSHVSLLIDMGFSPVAIAERVGHESIEITFRYAHLFPSKQSEMATRLGDAMEPDS